MPQTSDKQLLQAMFREQVRVRRAAIRRIIEEFGSEMDSTAHQAIERHKIEAGRLEDSHAFRGD